MYCEDNAGVIVKPKGEMKFNMSNASNMSNAVAENVKGKSRNLRWSKPMAHTLLAVLADEALKGNKPSSTFKSSSFQRAAKEFTEKFKIDCLAGHVENHLKTVKKEWTVITTIRGKSGFGWDDNLKMITAEKNVYEEEVMAHPTHERYLNKKIEMYDEMQLVVGKDLATGLYAKSFVDLDAASTEMDSNPLEDAIEKETSVSSVPSSEKRSHRKRKQMNYEANDGGIKELAMEVREIAKAMKDMTKQQLNVSDLYAEVMKVEEFDETILGAAFDYLVQNEMLAKAIVKNKSLRKIWIQKFAEQYKG